jgi:hypothetical protein
MLVSEVVNRALRILGVQDAAASTEAIDSQTAIVALNALCGRWEANGLAMGWSAVSAPDDTLPAPDEAAEAITWNLAVRLAPEYGKGQRARELMPDAERFLAELRRDRLVEMPLVQCSDLPRTHGHWNIYTDEPV